MEIKDTTSGLTLLGKTALPLIGRVGTVVGGIVSLLAVFDKVSGQVVTTIEGFLLVSAVIASGIVALHRSDVIIGETKKKVFSYPRNTRVIAGTIMLIAIILLAFFGMRLWANANPGSRLAIGGIRQGPQANPTRPVDRAGKPGVTPAPPSPIPTLPATATRTATATMTATPLPTIKTLTVTPFPVDQMTDVNLLNKLGNDALTAKKYNQAIGYFSRATLIEATNAQAQFGLGQAYFYLNNFNAAFDPFQVSLRLDINLHDAHAYLGWVYDYRGDRAKAIAEYDVFLRAAPRDDPWRQDISDRLKLLNSKGPIPTLTPYATPALNITTVPTNPPPTNVIAATVTPSK